MTQPTNPAPPMTDHEMLVSLMVTVSDIASDVSAIKAETAGLTKAFHDINANMSAIRADNYISAEQLRSIGTTVGELYGQLERLRDFIRGEFAILHIQATRSVGVAQE